MVNDGGARANWHDVEKWPSYRCKVIPARDTPMAAVTYDSPQCPFVRMGSAGQDLEANVTENCKDSFMLRTVSTNLRNKTSSLTIYLCPWNIYTVLELLKIWLHSIRSYFEALLEADITVVSGRSLSWGNVCCASTQTSVWAPAGMAGVPAEKDVSGVHTGTFCRISSSRPVWDPDSRTKRWVAGKMMILVVLSLSCLSLPLLSFMYAHMHIYNMYTYTYIQMLNMKNS